MSNKHYLVLYLYIFTCNLFAQSNTKSLIEIKDLVTNTIQKKCHLIELSDNNNIIVNKDTLTVKINFYNKSLKSYWSPEVAVQYIFDAALYNITDAIYKKYTFYKIIFLVDIRPHDIPPVLKFEIKFKDWKSYLKSHDKKLMFKKMNVYDKVENIPFKYNILKAITIE